MFCRHSALQLSCFSGLHDVVECLLVAGSDVNCTGPMGMTPFFIACDGGSLKLLEILVEYGAETTAKFENGYDLRNMLYFAVLPTTCLFCNKSRYICVEL